MDNAMQYDISYLTEIDFYNKLKNFVESQKKPFFESQALKVVYDLPSVANITPLNLFRYHFSLFRMLYKLQDFYYKKNYYLHVHFMRSFLTAYPSSSLCREYDPSTGLFCKSETENDQLYCPFHQSKKSEVSLEATSLKYFYYSDENFYNLDENRAEAFINGTWELLFCYEQFKSSRLLLDLPENCTLDMVKKAYRSRVKTIHPDITNQPITDEFIKINDAYQFLIKTIPHIRL